MTDEITVLVTTCDRYQTLLPLCLLSIVNQTYKPNRIVLVDDNLNKEFYDHEILRNVLTVMKYRNIEFQYLYGESKGCSYALQRGLDVIDSGWILKVDDDNILEPNVIELYVQNISEEIGAMGGLILDNKSFLRKQEFQSIYNQIGDLYSKINIQMVATQTPDIKEVEHIYSNYFFRKDVAPDQCLKLTPSCHREDTIFTHEIFRKGYRLIVIPQSKTYHMNYDDTVGDNKHGKANMNNNEFVFIEKLKEWDIVPKKIEIIEEKNRYVTPVVELGGRQTYIVMEK